jgi:PAS domain S-box-containing protein
MAASTQGGRVASLLPELKSYIGFGDDDAEALRTFYPFAAPHFTAIADEFYAMIRMHEGALSVLKDEAQARRLHASLRSWMGELLLGPHDEAYFERRGRIGQVHVRVGLSQHYMVTAMSRVRTSLQGLARQACANDRAASDRLNLAILRVCDLDLAIMLESYSESYLARLSHVQKLERDALEAELLEGKRFFREALEGADCLVLGLNAAGKVLFFNRKAEQLTGYGADEMLASDPFGRLFPDREHEVRSRVLSAANGKPIEFESDLATRAGKHRIVLWRAAPYQGTNGASAIISIGYDVTEQRELEQIARRSERLAATGVLAAGLAHEIRNPLNGATLHLAVLERALARTREVPLDAREAVEVLRTETRRLSTLVTDFLDVARPKPLVRTECDLNDLVSGIVTLLRPEAEAREITLRFEPSPFAIKAHVDAERLRQVLLNLARNAIEAVGERGEVTMRARRVGRALELQVEDSGPGLADPSAPIFDAFYTTKERGTGLGLSIVHRIVEDHGGKVAVSSRPGSTTFTVQLPMTDEEPLRPQKRPWRH